jgi:hypothetical protein
MPIVAQMPSTVWRVAFRDFMYGMPAAPVWRGAAAE